MYVLSLNKSCYGTVSSLNGEPEQGVAVEALGQKDCSIYGEDTVTDEEGKFRLRGLLVMNNNLIFMDLIINILN